jgi:hypothetical protein
VAVLALVAGLVTLDSAATAAVSVRVSARLGIDDLGRLAGVRDPNGRPAGLDPIPIAIVQEGGPMWIAPQVEAAVRDDGGFVPADGPHQLRVEVIATDTAVAMRLALWRRGWSVALPRPIVAWSAPWIAVVAGALGALAVARGLGLGVGLALAGVMAQLASTWLPWPVPTAPPTLIERWTDGPAATWLRHLAQRLPDSASAIGLAVVAACAVLIAFDHRRSRGRGGRLVLGGVAATLGVVAWGEAAVRLGVPGLAVTGPGWLTLVGLAGLWWTATRHRSAAHA